MGGPPNVLTLTQTVLSTCIARDSSTTLWSPVADFPLAGFTRQILSVRLLKVYVDPACCWVAVKELKLSYYIGETLLFTIYTHYGNLI